MEKINITVSFQSDPIIVESCHTSGTYGIAAVTSIILTACRNLMSIDREIGEQLTIDIHHTAQHVSHCDRHRLRVQNLNVKHGPQIAGLVQKIRMQLLSLKSGQARKGSRQFPSPPGSRNLCSERLCKESVNELLIIQDLIESAADCCYS